MKKVLTAFVATLVLAAASAAMAAPIVMDGSTTVLPFGQAAVEQYMKEHQGVQFSVSGTGTGNGFKSLADGAAQIANASRFIKDSEIQNCIGLPGSLRGSSRLHRPHRPQGQQGSRPHEGPA